MSVPKPEDKKPEVKQEVKTPLIKPAQTVAAKPSVQSSAAPSVVADKPAEKATEKMNVFKEDSWMYNKDYEPKLFKRGESIPDGWSHVNKWGWYKDQKNHFRWRKRP